MSESRTYLVKTFGCQMNEHDSERIAGLLEGDGMEQTESLDDADVVVLNTCCACTDCDQELPRSFGFVLLDFKLVNAAVSRALPFDPDASPLPVQKPVTVRSASHLVGVEKVVLQPLAWTLQPPWEPTCSN